MDVTGNSGRLRFSLRDNPYFVLGVLFVVALFNYLDRSLISILQIPIKTELGLSDAELGALTGFSFAVLYAGAAIPIALQVDRRNRTRLLAIGLFVWTALTALTGFATGFIVLAILRMGVALGESVSVPATHSLISDYFPLARRGRALSVWALASPLGVTIGIALGGWLTDLLGWRDSFLAIGLAGFLLVPLVLMLREPARGRFDGVPPAASGARMDLIGGVRFLFGIPAFKLLVIATTLHSYTYQSIMMWMPPFLSRTHGLTMTDIALWSALMVGVGGGLGTLSGGYAIDFLARRDARWYAWAPGFMAAILVPFAAVLYLVEEIALVFAFGFLSIASASFFIAPVNALAQSMVRADLRGLTAAILLVFPTGFGLGLGPLATGGFSDLFAEATASAEWGLRCALLLALAGSLIAAIVFWRLGARLKEQTTLAAAAP